MTSPPRRLLALLLLACCFALSPHALADVRALGEWPSDERVSLSLERVSRDRAARALAEAAGWSLVAEDLGDELVSLEVEDQPAREVLELLLARGRFVAERRGELVALRPESGAATPSAPPRLWPPPQGAPKSGEDLLVTERAHVVRGQEVGDVIVFQGSVLIEGTVRGDLAVFGGEATLAEGARVKGEVIALGGVVDLQNGAVVDGEVNALFGKLQRGERVKVDCPTCGEPAKMGWPKFFEQFFERLTGAALFWLFGALLVAAAYPRVELVRAELLRRPLRCLGLGLLGALGLVLLLATLVVTLIGIPLAVLSALAAALSVYVGFCVVLLTLGGLIARGRSDSPYGELALGCAAYFLILWVPVVGALAATLGLPLALGGLIGSRGAGLFTRARAR